MWNVTVMHSRRWGRGWVWKSQGRLAWTQSSRRWYGDGDSGDGNRMEMETGTTGMIGDGDHLLSPKALWVWRSYRRKYGVFLFWNAVYWKLIVRTHRQLECGPIPNVMAAQPNIGGALCESSVIPFFVPRRKVWLTPTAKTPKPLKFAGVPQTPEPSR